MLKLELETHIAPITTSKAVVDSRAIYFDYNMS